MTGNKRDTFLLEQDTITKRRCPHKSLYVSAAYLDGDTWTACFGHTGVPNKRKNMVTLKTLEKFLRGDTPSKVSKVSL